jgi:hypothetical protein
LGRSNHTEFVVFWVGEDDERVGRTGRAPEVTRTQGDDPLGGDLLVVDIEIHMNPVLRHLMFGDLLKPEVRVASRRVAKSHPVVTLRIGNEGLFPGLLKSGDRFPEKSELHGIVTVDDDAADSQSRDGGFSAHVAALEMT